LEIHIVVVLIRSQTYYSNSKGQIPKVKIPNSKGKFQREKFQIPNWES